MKNYTKLVDKQFKAYMDRLTPEKKDQAAVIEDCFNKITAIVEKHSDTDRRYKKLAIDALDRAIILTLRSLAINI